MPMVWRVGDVVRLADGTEGAIEAVVPSKRNPAEQRIKVGDAWSTAGPTVELLTTASGAARPPREERDRGKAPPTSPAAPGKPGETIGDVLSALRVLFKQIDGMCDQVAALSAKIDDVLSAEPSLPAGSGDLVVVGRK